MKTRPTAKDAVSLKLLREIFALNKPGEVATEAFGEAFFLLNMSSRVNGKEGLTDEQHQKIREIWSRRTGPGPGPDVAAPAL